MVSAPAKPDLAAIVEFMLDPEHSLADAAEHFGLTLLQVSKAVLSDDGRTAIADIECACIVQARLAAAAVLPKAVAVLKNSLNAFLAEANTKKRDTSEYLREEKHERIRRVSQLIVRIAGFTPRPLYRTFGSIPPGAPGFTPPPGSARPTPVPPTDTAPRGAGPHQPGATTDLASLSNNFTDTAPTNAGSAALSATTIATSPRRVPPVDGFAATSASARAASRMPNHECRMPLQPRAATIIASAGSPSGP